MIKDVEILNACSLGYIEAFGKSEHGMTVEELCGDKDQVNPTERTIYWNYKLKGEYPYRKYLKDWVLVYTSDYNRIAREYLKLDYEIEGGFRATVWKKDKNVIIAYTGTNDTSDMIDDLEIAYQDDYNNQLSAAYMLYLYVKKYYAEEKDTIYLVGHSLGGALAQFVYCSSYTKENHYLKMVTFNGLGIGTHKGDYVISKSKFKSAIKRYLTEVPERDYIMNEMWDFMYEGYAYEKHPIEDKDKSIDFILNRLRIACSENKLQFGFLKVIGFFKFGIKKTENKEDKYNTKIPLDYVKYIANMIYYMCLTSYNFQKYYFDAFYSTSGTNYYLQEDWVPSLQTKSGINICLDMGTAKFDVVDDSKFRVIKATINKVGFKRHSVGIFIMYLDESGNLINGNMNKNMVSNMYKELVYSWMEKERNMGREHTYDMSVLSDGRVELYVDREMLNQVEHIELNTINKINVIDRKFTLAEEYKRSIYKVTLGFKYNELGEIEIGVVDNFSYLEVDTKKKPLILKFK